MENSFWDKHYQQFEVHEPSKFAQYCLDKHLTSSDSVIELGCGNGRDGTAFGHFTKKYLGIDACPIAVNAFKKSLNELPSDLRQKMIVQQGDFTNIDFNELTSETSRLVIYSRFSLHSIGYKDAENLFENLVKIKNVPWTFLLEARTIYDTLYGQGESVGMHEFKTDHYRRFIDPNVFLKTLANKFSVSYFEVSSGFAPFGDQDPLIMRAVFQS
jgi:SAM-dependent methyltransferase